MWYSITATINPIPTVYESNRILGSYLEYARSTFLSDDFRFCSYGSPEGKGRDTYSDDMLDPSALTTSSPLPSGC